MESPHQKQVPDSSERRNSFGSYLKRFRTSVKKQPSTKSIKVNTTDLAPNDAARSPRSMSSRSPTPLTDAERRPLTIQSTSASVVPLNDDTSSVDKPGPLEMSPTLTTELPTPSNGKGKEVQSTPDQYGSILEEEDRQLYSQADSLERVEKTPQMRVHYYCHECRRALDSNDLCVSCEHKRCSMCLRVPQRRERSLGTSRKKSTETSPTSPTSPVESPHPPSANVRTFSYRPRELPDTAILSSTQKIRWICHKCDAFFILDERECQNCGHVKCSKCSRYPAKTATVSTQHPPDRRLRSSHSEPQVRERTYRRPRIRVRYTCEKCSTLFVENNKTCEECGHMRCSNCPRQPPRREELRNSDPALLRAVENRLANYTTMIEPPGNRHAVNVT